MQFICLKLICFLVFLFSFVNFEKEKSNARQHRFNQPACNGCGNCCSGCNTGAKNTLNMNYLPDARAHGAEIFTEVNLFSPYQPVLIFSSPLLFQFM